MRILHPSGSEEEIKEYKERTQETLRWLNTLSLAIASGKQDLIRLACGIGDINYTVTTQDIGSILSACFEDAAKAFQKDEKTLAVFKNIANSVFSGEFESFMPEGLKQETPAVPAIQITPLPPPPPIVIPTPNSPLGPESVFVRQSPNAGIAILKGDSNPSPAIPVADVSVMRAYGLMRFAIDISERIDHLVRDSQSATDRKPADSFYNDVGSVTMAGSPVSTFKSGDSLYDLVVYHKEIVNFERNIAQHKATTIEITNPEDADIRYQIDSMRIRNAFTEAEKLFTGYPVFQDYARQAAKEYNALIKRHEQSLFAQFRTIPEAQQPSPV